MAIFMIGYDLHPKQGETYDELIKAIGALDRGGAWHCLDSTWLVRSELSAKQISDALWKHMRSDDQLLVVKYEPHHSAWAGFTGDCNTWLKNNM